MSAEKILGCTDCHTINCEYQDRTYPEFCRTTSLTEQERDAAQALYREEENRKVSQVSARIEAEFYGRFTRVEETVTFIRRMGYRKVGIATCVGLIRESRIFVQILRAHGIEAVSVACKVGAMPKTGVIGLEEQWTERTGAVMCNPVLQAMVLNREKTELNVVIGLCVGHDSLFYKYSEALCTTLIAKDRALAHNPVGALYQSESYFRRVMAVPEEGTP